MLYRILFLALLLWAPHSQAEPSTRGRTMFLSLGEPSEEQAVALAHQTLLEGRANFESELVHYVMMGFGDTLSLTLSRPDNWFHRIAEMPSDHAAWRPLGDPMRFSDHGSGGDAQVRARLKEMAARFVRIVDTKGWTATGVVRPLYAVHKMEATEALGGRRSGHASETEPRARPADSRRPMATRHGPVEVMPPVRVTHLATAGQLQVTRKERDLRFGFAPIMTGKNSVWSRLWVPDGDGRSVGCDVLPGHDGRFLFVGWRGHTPRTAIRRPSFRRLRIAPGALVNP